MKKSKLPKKTLAQAIAESEKAYGWTQADKEAVERFKKFFAAKFAKEKK